MTTLPASDLRDLTTVISSVFGEFPVGMIGVPTGEIRVSWRIESSSHTRQLAFEVEAARDHGFSIGVTSSGVVEADTAHSIVVPSGPLLSREVRHVRVRIATDIGWTEWGPSLTVEGGLGAAVDWSAKAVGIPSFVGGPSPLLRRSFELRDAPSRARLYVTSLGLNSVQINGQSASDTHLAPGWTSYRRRVIVATHDVTKLLVPGANVIGARLGDGWYRGRLGWEGRDSLYGTELALIAQLEVEYPDGTTQTLITDTSWRGAFGAIRASGIYDGADIDYREEPSGWASLGFDDSTWVEVHEVALDPTTLEPQSAPPVREIAEFPMTRLTSSPGVVLDAGQNIAGWVRLVVDGHAGQVVTVRHAEVLELDGSLHVRSLRSARATDVYTLAVAGVQTLVPEFTFHGFRYADVVSDAIIVEATAIAVSSDTAPRGRFSCSEPDLNRLHSNVIWSQRDNFVSVPTDCPQRDERLGWTGDAQAFAATASTLFDTESFWLSWLKDLEADQAPDGGVASVVPNILGPDAFLVNGVGQPMYGRAGWADAASIVPWTLYESFGDVEPLRQQLSSMRRWVDHLDARRAGLPLLPTEFQFGDWLDPDAPGDQPWAAKVSADFVANAFFARSARIQAWVEDLVGRPDRAAHYAGLADEVSTATWAEWGDHVATTQSGCAIALEFGIVPDEQRASLGEALAALVRKEDGRISTGFLGTPLVLHALSSTEHLDEAYQMLLCRDVPSWLYQVRMGATTVWERWDALRPDGSIHPGDMANSDESHMLSFNHYAYGAVADWLYRTVAGIAPVAADPGYRTIRVAPRPTESITWATAAIETRQGELSIDWRLTATGDLEIQLVVPFGSRATLDLPLTATSTATAAGEIGHGTHSILVTHPAVAVT